MSERKADARPNLSLQGRCRRCGSASAWREPASADGHRQRHNDFHHCHLLRRLLWRQRRRREARGYAQGRERPPKLRAGRYRQAAPRGAVRRRSAWSRSPPTASWRPTRTVAPGGTTIDIPIKAEWGAGAYALVTAWRPLAAPAERTPVRAIGRSGSGSIPSCARSPSRSARRRSHAAPAHRGAGARSPTSQGRRPRHPRRRRRGHPAAHALQDPQPADSTSASALGVAMRDDYGRLLDGRPTNSAASAPAATPATSAASTRADADRRPVQRPVRPDDRARPSSRSRSPTSSASSG